MKRFALPVIVCVCIFWIAGCENQDSQEIRVRHPQLLQVEEQVRRSIENALAKWREQLSGSQLPVERAQAYAQLGQVYLSYQFNEAAADALQYATSQIDSNPNWYYYFATSLERSFRLDEAHSALTSSLELRDHPEVRFARANVRARLGDVVGALHDVNYLKDRARLNSSDQEGSSANTLSGVLLDDKSLSEAAWYALDAELLTRQKYYPEAQESLSKALELAPQASALNVAAGLLATLAGEPKKARRLLDAAGAQLPVADQPLLQALEALSRGSQYYLQRGRTWMQKRNFQQAVIDFAAAADIAPSSHEALLAHARALEIIGDVDAAESRYLEAELLAPDSAVTHYFLGMLYERRKLDDKSREYYAKALDSNPVYFPPRLSLAHAHFRNRNYEEALVHYTEYAAARDSDFEPRYYAGLAALALGFCETAPQWFEKAVKINSHNRDAQVGLARSYAVCSSSPDELNQAQDIAERLEESRPDAAAAATLAMVHAALNDWESAISQQKIAIRRSDEKSINGQRDRLTDYESSQRARVAWLSGDAVFNPPRLTMRVLR